MITAEKLQKVIHTLEQFTDEGVFTLELRSGSIRRDSSGQIFACLAGIYTLARCNGEWAELEYGEAEWHFRPEGEAYRWEEGADEMSHDLGFLYSKNYEYADYTHLERWARDNPELWGNKYGGEMFSESRAYGVDSVTLSDVLNHLRSVADRLAQREAVA